MPCASLRLCTHCTLCPTIHSTQQPYFTARHIGAETDAVVITSAYCSGLQQKVDKHDLLAVRAMLRHILPPPPPPATRPARPLPLTCY